MGEGNVGLKLSADEEYKHLELMHTNDENVEAVEIQASWEEGGKKHSKVFRIPIEFCGFMRGTGYFGSANLS